MLAREASTSGSSKDPRVLREKKRQSDTTSDWTYFCPDPSNCYEASVPPSTVRTGYASTHSTATEEELGPPVHKTSDRMHLNRKVSKTNDAEDQSKALKPIHSAQSRPLFRFDGGLSVCQMVAECAYCSFKLSAYVT